MISAAALLGEVFSITHYNPCGGLVTCIDLEFVIMVAGLPDIPER